MAEIVEYIGRDESDHEDPRDHEDPGERNDYNIEEAIAGFNDEPPIRHDVYPDSESDEEEDVPRRERDRSDMRRGNGNLYKGQVFYNGIAFKEAVLDYVLNTARNIQQYRYDKTKLGFNCVGDNCEWPVHTNISLEHP